MSQSYSVAKLCCEDYGFECDFKAEGEVESVISKFAEHTQKEHGIEYQKEALMQFIIRKGQSWGRLCRGALFWFPSLHNKQKNLELESFKKYSVF